VSDLPDAPLHDWSCFEIAAAVRDGDVSAEEVTRHHLDRIEERADLNALIAVMGEQALADARSLPEHRRTGPLAGVPFAPKDLFDVAGMPTTAGGLHQREAIARSTAWSVQRLVDAGAIVVGKANLSEYAWGVTSQNVHYGFVQNPRHPGRIAGGSSGGSAAGLAGGLFALTLGTDTGGSIRIPSAACGTSGYKGSWGLVPDDGCFPLIPQMDHVGPMARTMRECALALDAMGVLATPPPRLEGLRVGVLHPTPAADAIAALGNHVEEAVLPDYGALFPLFVAWAADTHRDRMADGWDLYSEDLQRKLTLGREMDALSYLQAERDLDAYARTCELALTHDVLVNPTIPCELGPVSEPETFELRLRMTPYTRAFNHLGWPSCTTRDGLMFSGRDDATVLAAALAWEDRMEGRAVTA
jgi:Asp-tRNA(Asn)/Glu-tRNA(Gln) amidotransferase A subunit family amidase